MIRTNVYDKMNIKALQPATTVITALRLALGAFTLLTAFAATADDIVGDPAAGEARAAACIACHGAGGNSVTPTWPSLAGQHANYLAKTLQDFKAGTRKDPVMGPQASLLNDQDIANLAAYFSAQKPVGRTANPELAEAGERLYRGGDKERDVSACIACHGPSGRGNAPAGYPSLSGQHAMYTAKQLSDYKNENRTSDGDAQIMRNITALLSQKQIDEVSAYIQGLR